MDNGTESLLDTYLFESNSLLSQLDELLIAAEKSGELTADNVNEIFRSMHTIKGSSAMLEFSSLMEIAHHIEDLFFYIRENGIDTLDAQQKNELFNLMFKSTDKLREEVEKVENNEPLSTNIDSFVTEINQFLKKISSAPTDTEESGPAESEGPSAAPHPNTTAPYILHVFFDDGCGMENLRSFMLVNALQDMDSAFTFWPDDVETNSESCDFIVENGFFLFFGSEEVLNSAVSIVNGTSNIRSYEAIKNPNYIPPKETTSAEEKVVSSDNGSSETAKAPAASKPASPKDNGSGGNAPGGNPQGAGTAAKQSLISVNLSKLDSLMAIVGEIVITESMVTACPELHNVKLDSFLKSARQLRKLTDDLQDIAMSLRMVPVSGVFQKMNRIVRDMKQSLNKDTRLTIIGEDTEVDKTIVDSISDPIMHIVRNSMDHGIEDTEEERIAADKPAQAEIVLSARHTGSEVIISVSDDGKGMDPDRILQKAKENGILVKPEEEYSQKEILSLLMAPGFSTNQEVTEYSGRGVGLDVVKKNVEAIGGIVTITSEKGRGSCTTLKIPLTLAIVDGMEICVGDSIFTIPIANIRQSFKAVESEIILDAANHEMIKCMDDFYPIIRINELFNIEPRSKCIEDGILMWVEASDKSYCLFVDDLVGEQQVVVKPLPPYLNNYNIKHSGISGCTILGDGNISIILDIANVYSAGQNMF